MTFQVLNVGRGTLQTRKEKGQTFYFAQKVTVQQFLLNDLVALVNVYAMFVEG